MVRVPRAKGGAGVSARIFGLLLITVIAPGGWLSTFAAEKAPQRAKVRDTVIVPYDPGKPVREQKPDNLYVPYERFLELWEAAKVAHGAEKPFAAPRDFALSSARYDATMEEGRVAISVTIMLTTFNSAWVKVPLPFDVRVGSLELDGAPVSLADGVVLVEKPGAHTITARLEIPLPRGQRAFGWNVPRTAATRLTVALAEPRWRVQVQPDAGVIERIVDGKKSVTAAIGATDTIRVTLVEGGGPERVVKPALAQITTAISVSTAYERANGRVAFSFPGAQQDKFSVHIRPADAVLAGIEAPGMKSWSLRKEDGGQVLDVVLSEPAKERYEMAVVTERPQLEELPGERAALSFGADAKRIEVVQELYAGTGAGVVAQAAASLRQTERNLKVAGEWTPVGSWSGAGPLAYRIALDAAKREARTDYVYQVNHRKIELIASMQLFARKEPLLDVTLSLPEGFEVQAVDSERLLDWWRDGAKLRVRFKGATPEKTPLVVYLVRLYAAAPKQLDVQPLVIEGFSKVTGEAVVAGHKGVEAALKLTGAADSAREVDAAKAATDFQILAPLERKRGFVFKNQAFAGQVALAPLPPKWAADWVLHAQAHETWASLSLGVQLSMRQGSMDRVAFSLPEALPEGRVRGPQVRETRARVEKGRRVYEVEFQDDVHDAVDLAVDFDVPMGPELALPAPEFGGAQFVSGHVVADNASDYELKLTTEGAEPVRIEELTMQPTVTKSAGIFRVRPEWKIVIGMDRLEKMEARPAFCAWAEMTTALRRDGSEWHRAVWRLQNRSLQFLPVRLPAGAELVSARVAGQGVRADAGVVNGVQVILVPLIKTRPGDVSYDVEVVWRHVGVRMESRGTRKFDDAEAVGVTVERTLWNVWLPEDRELTDSNGNMRAVLDVLHDVEKGRTQVEELKALNKLIQSGTLKGEALANAQRNFMATCDVLNKSIGKNDGVLGSNWDSLNVLSKAASVKTRKDVQSLWDEGNVGNTYNAKELEKAITDNGRILSEQGMSRDVQALQGQGQLNVPAPLPQARSGEEQRKDKGLKYDGRWKSKVAEQKQQAAKQEAGRYDDASKSNLVVNDSIVIQQAKVANQPVPPADAKPAKPGEMTKQPPLQMEFGGKGSGFGKLREKDALSADAKKPVAKSEELAQSQTRELNTARGNPVFSGKDNARDEEIGEISVATEQRAASPAELPYFRGRGNQEGQRSSPTAPALATGTAAGSGKGAGEGSKNAPAPGVDPFSNLASPPPNPVLTGLEADGRISLAVDFPTEGRVYRFLKLKSHAELVLHFADPKSGLVWTNVWIFSGIAAGLFAIGRFAAARRGRRAVAGHPAE